MRHKLLLVRHSCIVDRVVCISGWPEDVAGVKVCVRQTSHPMLQHKCCCLARRRRHLRRRLGSFFLTSYTLVTAYVRAVGGLKCQLGPPRHLCSAALLLSVGVDRPAWTHTSSRYARRIQQGVPSCRLHYQSACCVLPPFPTPGWGIADDDVVHNLSGRGCGMMAEIEIVNLRVAVRADYTWTDARHVALPPPGLRFCNNRRPENEQRGWPGRSSHGATRRRTGTRK
ncbi:hypothetical protein K461DRAFT_133868 [Myriangium duriaei CBS 260.36]|uniref:Uncharacterized protein n=1 Tax=Myriangium duriaei CBS 260.36 TaxID=1168546 RepID=A0A9P4MHD1_9PEZI|nr:hypothetical protein K461DRAFT_133868 [Myriangium duriaei CBS 260.36]